MHRFTRIAVMLWAIVVFATPLVLFVAGRRGAAFENRALAPPPDISIGSILDQRMYAGIEDYLEDHLPLRERGVAADAWIDFHVFDDSPRPDRVLVGADGWLFNTNSFEGTCIDLPSAAEVVANADLLAAVLAAAGKDVLITVVPHKHTVYPDRLGSLADRAGCALAVAETLHRQLEATPPSGYVDVWDLLTGAKGGPDPVYRRDDTHWSPAGSALGAAALLDGLAPGLWETASALDEGIVGRVGDLTRQMGLSHAESYRSLVVDRPGTTVRETDITVDGLPAATRYEAVVPTGTPVVSGTTVLLGDSYAAHQAGPHLAPYFADLYRVTWRGVRLETRCCRFDIGPRRAPEQWLLEHLAIADQVIIETVEMRFWERFATPRLALLAMDALSETLPHLDLATGARRVRFDAAVLDEHPGRPYLVVHTPRPPPFGAEISRLDAGSWRHLSAVDSLEETGVAVLDLSTMRAEGTLRATTTGRDADFTIVWVT